MITTTLQDIATFFIGLTYLIVAAGLFGALDGLNIRSKESKMTKQQRARDFGHKEAAFWRETNKPENLRGQEPFDLAWMLGNAWRHGFESGQRHQIKLQKEKSK